MFPMSQFFEKTKNVLRFCTFILFERMVITVKMVRERGNEIFDLFEDSCTDIKLNLDSCIFLFSFRDQVCHLKLNFTEFGDDIMESVTKNRIMLLLINLKVKFLEKFVFSFD